VVKHDIYFKIYNNEALLRKRLELQFNFNVKKIEIYKGDPDNPILCTTSGIDTDTIHFVFQNPITSAQRNIDVHVEGSSSGSPRLDRLIWVTISEFDQNKINRINSQYFP